MLHLFKNKTWDNNKTFSGVDYRRLLTVFKCMGLFTLTDRLFVKQFLEKKTDIIVLCCIIITIIGI